MASNPELILQIQLAEYIRLQYPTVIFRSDLAGIRLTPGQAKQARQLNGGLRGFPDMVVMELRRGFYGLCLELKASEEKLYTKRGGVKKDKHIDEQRAMLYELEKRGYYTRFACGFDEAKRIIDWYLGEVQ